MPALANTIFYGDVSLRPETFSGLGIRLNNVAQNNVIDEGGNTIIDKNAVIAGSYTNEN